MIKNWAVTIVAGLAVITSPSTLALSMADYVEPYTAKAVVAGIMGIAALVVFARSLMERRYV